MSALLDDASTPPRRRPLPRPRPLTEQEIVDRAERKRLSAREFLELLLFLGFGVVPALEAQMKKYIYNVLVGLDMFGNTLIGGLPDETISAHAGRLRAKGSAWARGLSWALDKIQPQHCAGAIEGDELRAEAVLADEEAAEKETGGAAPREQSELRPLISRQGLYTTPDFPCPFCGTPVYLYHSSESAYLNTENNHARVQLRHLSGGDNDCLKALLTRSRAATAL